MNLSELKEKVVALGFQYPHLRDKIYEAYRWCVGEVIDYGGSESQEVQSCLSDIEDIIWEDQDNSSE
jgi:hypothetical protein